MRTLDREENFMKKSFTKGLIAFGFCAAVVGFVACGDESSSGPSKNEETGIETEVSSSSENDEAISSSRVKDEKSSSSKKVESSSSSKTDVSSSSTKIENSSSSVNVKESSSSGKVESSSSKNEVSSSSQNVQSSSSDKPVESSSSETKPVETSSSEKSSSSMVQFSSSSETILSSNAESSSSNLVITPCKINSEDNCDYGVLYDDRDDKTYKTVKIGNQEWMAENLNFEYNEGSAKSFCYKNDTTNCTTYGRLYNWSAAIDSISYYNEYNKQCGWKQSKCSIPTLWKGICPNGSHIPSLDEWKDLLSNLDSTIAGKALKSLEYWAEGKNGEDFYGFSVLPSGEWSGSNYVNKGKKAVYWMATDFSKESAHLISFSNTSDKVLIMDDWKTHEYSIRCIKN